MLATLAIYWQCWQFKFGLITLVACDFGKGLFPAVFQNIGETASHISP